MSVQATSYVWEHSTQKGTNLLLLLAIANIADTRGFAYPGVKRLAKDIRMSERNTQRAIHECEESGELEVRRNAGPHGTNIYWIVMNDTLPLFAPGGGDNLTPDRLAGVKTTAQGVTKTPSPGDTAMSPETTTTTKNRRSSAQGRAAPLVDKPTVETWNAYCEEMQGRYGIQPDNNAKSRGQLAQLVALVGKEQAPKVVRFYFTTKVEFYERMKHSIGILLKDAHKLVVEMKQSEKRDQASAQCWWRDERAIMDHAKALGIQPESGDTFYRIAARVFLKAGDGPWMSKIHPMVSKYMLEYAQRQPA